MLKVNIFDNTCAHHVRDDGYFTSTDGRKPREISFVHKQQEYDGITIFTDNFILNTPVVTSVKSNIKIAWCLESPAVMPRVHNNIHQVADNFDYVFTYRTDLIEQDPKKFIPNTPGGAYLKDEFFGLYTNNKNKFCSNIFSAKRDLEGHKLRHHINRSIPQVDGFGSGTHPGAPFLRDKSPALAPYMFSFIIENIKYPHYFTEKLIDCLLAGCVPIYWGAPNIGDYFNLDGFIIFNSFDELKDKKITKQDYLDRLQAIAENYKTALLYKSSDDVLARKIQKLILTK